MNNIENIESGSLPENHFPSENHLTNLFESRYARRSAHLSATLAIAQAPICQNTFETKHFVSRTFRKSKTRNISKNASIYFVISIICIVHIL